MRETFSAIGLEFERVPAVDARDLDQATIDRVSAASAPSQQSFWTPGTVACLLSHRRVWQIIHDRDDARAAVFEDDVLVRSGLRELLATAHLMPAEVRMLRLEAAFRVQKLGPKRPLLHAPNRFYAPMLGFVIGSAAYVVSRSLTARLITVADTEPAAADALIWNPALAFARQETGYQVIPAPCAQTHFFKGLPELSTTIGSRPGRADSRPWRTRLAWKIRQYRRWLKGWTFVRFA